MKKQIEPFAANTTGGKKHNSHRTCTYIYISITSYVNWEFNFRCEGLLQLQLDDAFGWKLSYGRVTCGVIGCCVYQNACVNFQRLKLHLHSKKSIHLALSSRDHYEKD